MIYGDAKAASVTLLYVMTIHIYCGQAPIAIVDDRVLHVPRLGTGINVPCVCLVKFVTRHLW